MHVYLAIPLQYMAEPLLQVRSNTLVQYSLCPKYYQHIPESGALPPGFFRVDEETGEIIRNAYSGEFTKGAKKRLKKSVELLCQAAKEYQFIKNPVTGKYHPFQLTFTTLTFPDDELIPACEATKTCLEPFLRWMRTKWACDMYVWKAELQKRGQLHYHITANCFIPWTEVRRKWNELQKSAGYLENFHKKFGHYSPPGTEIKGVRNKKDLAGYLEKKLMKTFTIIDEATKDIQNQDEFKQAISVYGKVWDCSSNLKSEDYYTASCSGETYDNLCHMIENKEVDIIELPRCTIFKMKPDDKGKIQSASKVLGSYDKRMYGTLMEKIRTYKAKRFEEPDPPPNDTAIKVDLMDFSKN